LGTVLPAFLVGTYLMANQKGTPLHKALGRIYLTLMIATGVTTLLMPAEVGPRFLGHLGFIHLFSVLTLYSAPAAYIYVRRGNIKAHRGNMIALYIGGLLIAGAFALMPGRLLHAWLF
jgi:uncharacterized membrane protein